MNEYLSDEELIPLLNGILEMFKGTNITISELAEIAHKQIKKEYGLRKRKSDFKKVDYYCLGRLRLFIGNLKNKKPLR